MEQERGVEPLIVTLELDPASFEFFQALRQRHFPPHRNFIPAHVTLFHALPGEEQARITQDLAQLAARQAPFAVHFPRLRSLGRGVAAELEAAPLVRVRSELAASWADWLTKQDSQPHRPHLTIQNKVTPEAARALLETLSASWQPPPGLALGLRLWRYLGGPWEALDTFSFQAAAPDSQTPVSPEHGASRRPRGR